ncbi:MAG: FUSC family protein [Candidatus Binataceae bacterium]
MATAPGIELRSRQRLRGLAAAAARRMTHGVDRLFNSLALDLEAHPRRMRTAIRTGFICALGFGLMAAAHVDALLGPYVLWIMVSAGGAMITPFKALRYVLVVGAGLALSVPLAGQLSEAPWLMLPFLFVAAFGFRYVMSASRLAYAWIVVEITFLTTFYLVVFDPHNFAVEVASTFGGVVISVILVALFDIVLWPNPADAELIVMLQHNLARTRRRLDMAGSAFFAPPGKSGVRIPGFLSDMPAHLALLERAAQEGATLQRRAVLLGAITLAERLHIAVDNLIVVAIDPLRRVARTMVQRQTEALVRALDAAFAERESELARGEIAYGENSAGSAVAAVRPAIDALEARIAQVRPALLAASTPAEAASMGSFAQGLSQTGELLVHGLEEPWLSDAVAEPPKTQGPDPALVRYSLKVAVAIVIGFVIGVASQRADLSVIITTVIIAGLPTYGATLNKMLLRLVGNVLGGALGLLAIVIVTPNFETLPVYMLVTFMGLFAADYLGLGNGQFAYAGRQMGSAFVFTWVGISPSEAITTPLYRVWGIILAMVVLTAVFILIWPEYSGDSLLPRLRKILHATLDLMPGGAAASSVRKIHDTSGGITRQLADLLGIADDARIEGQASRIDPDATVNASGTLRRIAHRVSAISRERIEAPRPALSAQTEAAHDRILAAMRARLESWRDHFDGPNCGSSRAALAIANNRVSDDIEGPLSDFTQSVGANGFAEIAGWPTPMRLELMSEIASLRRLAQLFANLDHELSRVAAARGALPSIAASAA